jgi:predicted ATPase
MKVVITGGPCSGKTTLINSLKNRGFNVIEETAREILGLNCSGYDYDKIQEEIAIKQTERESKFKEEEIVFLDRSLVDVIAYGKFCGGRVPGLALQGAKGYSIVFLLEQFPFEKDKIRIEKNEEEALQMHGHLISTYESLGYELIEVPAMPVEKRVEFVLLMLQRCGAASIQKSNVKSDFLMVKKLKGGV